MIYIFVLLYVLGGKMQYETADYKSQAECVEKGKARIVELEKNPGFGGVYANCIPVKSE